MTIGPWNSAKSSRLHQEVNDVLDLLYLRGYRRAMPLLGLFYALHVSTYLGIFNQPSSIMVVNTLAVALLFFVSYLGIRTGIVGPRWGILLATLCILAAGFNQVAGRIFLDQPIRSTPLLLMLVIASALIPRPGWFVGMLVGFHGLWIAGRWLENLQDPPLYWPLAVVQTSLISCTVWFLIRGLTLELAKLRVLERAKSERVKRLASELRTAVENVRVLKGLIPICSYCKKVRKDDGYWQQVEVYVRDRSEAEFTHAICPACKEKVREEIRNLPTWRPR